MIKTMIFNDYTSVKDNISLMAKGVVEIKLAGTDKVLFKGTNKVLLPGAEYFARQLFIDFLDPAECMPKYKTWEQEIQENVDGGGDGLANTFPYVYPIITQPVPPEVKGGQAMGLYFAVGNDGCGSNAYDVFDVKRNNAIAIESYLPFAVKEVDHSTKDHLYQFMDNGSEIVYAGAYAKDNPINNSEYISIGYFLKKVNGNPKLYISPDGENMDYYESNYTQIPSLKLNNSGVGSQVYIELSMKITTKDFREWFQLPESGENANKYINTISIMAGQMAGVPRTDTFNPGGIVSPSKKYPIHIRPITKLNFPNEFLVDDTKGLDIIYQIYF